MTNFTRLTVAPVLSLMLFGGMEASAVNHSVGFDIHNYAYKGKFNREQKKFCFDKADLVTRTEVNEGTLDTPDVTSPKPETSFSAAELIGDLDAPDGSTWFYTANYKYDYVEVSEYYKRPIMREYEFKIYDADLNLVGTIKDKVNYKEGEVAVPGAELAPFVTRNFFNSDDNYEVVVGLYVNTEVYVNNEYSIVYSIGGEKENGYDKPILVRKDLVGDVLNASVDGEENFYVTFMRDDNIEVEDTERDPDDPDYMGYWEMLTSYGMTVETYAKADASGNIVKVWEKRIRLADLPGDQMSSPFLISFMRDDKPYFLYTQYEDTFFNPYYDFIEETTMRENNHLVVDLYSVENGAFSLQKQTLIPTQLNNQDNDRVLCSYYSIGSLRYRDDIIFRDGATAPEYMVSVEDYSKENDENYNTSYYLYNADGSVKNVIFKNAISHSTLTDLPGFDPLEVFVSSNLMGDYVFKIVNLTTAEEELSFTDKFEIDADIDPELITSNMDRVPSGDSFKYAIELRSPGQDENGDDLMRVMWIDRNGKFERIDEIPMGNGVYYATVLIESQSLNPNLYDSDDEHEYLVLVKRGYPDNQVKEELLVAKPLSDAYPEGKIILYLKPEEERGILKNIIPLTYSEKPMLVISYYNEFTGMNYEDFYKLPLTASDTSVDMVAIGGGKDSGIEFDANCLRASGVITLYNMQGAKIAEGTDELNVAALPSGIYVAHANGSTVKILVK
ncbi:MAG: hypothetical protein K2J63_00925 [Muribaculaceae bacterium]|nr:hypothetical protein [Muribaculaceae bacterium]